MLFLQRNSVFAATERLVLSRAYLTIPLRLLTAEFFGRAGELIPLFSGIAAEIARGGAATAPSPPQHARSSPQRDRERCLEELARDFAAHTKTSQARRNPGQARVQQFSAPHGEGPEEMR